MTQEERYELDRLNETLRHLNPADVRNRDWIQAIEFRIRELVEVSWR